jgi:hypothetical protein
MSPQNVLHMLQEHSHCPYFGDLIGFANSHFPNVHPLIHKIEPT